MTDLFTPLEIAAWGGLVGAQGRMFRQVEDDLRRRAGITHAEFEVLLRLSFAPERRARIQDLAAKSLLTHSGTSRVVARLARADLVSREGATEDKRGAYAVLTDKGAALFRSAARQHVALVRREFLDRFTQPELEQLAALLQRACGPSKTPPTAP